MVIRRTKINEKTTTRSLHDLTVSPFYSHHTAAASGLVLFQPLQVTRDRLRCDVAGLSESLFHSHRFCSRSVLEPKSFAFD